MILDTGLDAACTTQSNPSTATESLAEYPAFCGFIRYAAIGTGSTAPDPSDTALDAQTGARTNNRGGFNNTNDAGRDTVNNTIWRDQTFTRVFDITSNMNATEWGLAPASSGNLSVRELFRADPLDSNSSPITLTLEDGDQLQLVITLRVEAAWEYQTTSFVITGTAGNDTNGTHTGNATVTSGASGSSDRIRAALQVAWPAQFTGANYGWPHALLSDQSGAAKGDDLPSAGTLANVGAMAAESYTPGAHYRDIIYTFTTPAANGDIYAINIGPDQLATGAPGVTNASTGYRYLLTNPPYLTKADTHRLTLTLRKTIARL